MVTEALTVKRIMCVCIFWEGHQCIVKYNYIYIVALRRYRSNLSKLYETSVFTCVIGSSILSQACIYHGTLLIAVLLAV